MHKVTNMSRYLNVMQSLKLSVVLVLISSIPVLASAEVEGNETSGGGAVTLVTEQDTQMAHYELIDFLNFENRANLKLSIASQAMDPLLVLKGDPQSIFYNEGLFLREINKRALMKLTPWLQIMSDLRMKGSKSALYLKSTDGATASPLIEYSNQDFFSQITTFHTLPLESGVDWKNIKTVAYYNFLLNKVQILKPLFLKLSLSSQVSLLAHEHLRSMLVNLNSADYETLLQNLNVLFMVCEPTIENANSINDLAIVLENDSIHFYAKANQLANLCIYQNTRYTTTIQK